MELSLGNILKCPSGTPGTPHKQYEMERIYQLEARQEEVSRVNKVTAPELMQIFTEGYGLAAKYAIQLEWELTQAKKYAEERKAIVYLEVAPKILQEKGLVRAANPSGSEDQRKAVLALDPEYRQLQDRVDMISATIEFMKLKADNFEKSYMSVRKVYDSLSSVNALANGINKPSGASTYAPEIPNKETTQTGGLAVGKPRY